jgi:hypothetical protein
VFRMPGFEPDQPGPSPGSGSDALVEMTVVAKEPPTPFPVSDNITSVVTRCLQVRYVASMATVSEAQGTSIRLYLADGRADGFRLVENPTGLVSAWSARAATTLEHEGAMNTPSQVSIS